MASVEFTMIPAFISPSSVDDIRTSSEVKRDGIHRNYERGQGHEDVRDGITTSLQGPKITITYTKASILLTTFFCIFIADALGLMKSNVWLVADEGSHGWRVQLRRCGFSCLWLRSQPKRVWILPPPVVPRMIEDMTRLQNLHVRSVVSYQSPSLP